MSTQDETFFDHLCDRTLAIQILFAIALTFFVINVPLLLFVYEWGSANNVVTVFNVVGSGAFMAVSYYAIRKCREL